LVDETLAAGELYGCFSLSYHPEEGDVWDVSEALHIVKVID
jgi:hypothetical protein